MSSHWRTPMLSKGQRHRQILISLIKRSIKRPLDLRTKPTERTLPTNHASFLEQIQNWYSYIHTSPKRKRLVRHNGPWPVQQENEFLGCLFECDASGIRVARK